MSPTYTYKSDLFQTMPDETGTLAIYISESRCTIAIASSSNVLVFLQTFAKPQEQYHHTFLAKLFSENQVLLSKHYQRVNIGVQTVYFTILPQEHLIEKDELMAFLSGTENRRIVDESLPSLDSRLIYSLPKSMHEVIEQTFQHFTLTLCTKFALSTMMQSEKLHCLLVLDQQAFDLIVKKNKQVYSVSRHSFDSPEDVLYYTLLALKDADIEPQDAELTLTGLCDKGDDVFHQLKEFIGKVKVQLQQNHITIPSYFDQSKQYNEYVLNLLYANH